MHIAIVAKRIRRERNHEKMDDCFISSVYIRIFGRIYNDGISFGFGGVGV